MGDVIFSVESGRAQALNRLGKLADVVEADGLAKALGVVESPPGLTPTTPNWQLNFGGADKTGLDGTIIGSQAKTIEWTNEDLDSGDNYDAPAATGFVTLTAADAGNYTINGAVKMEFILTGNPSNRTGFAQLVIRFASDPLGLLFLGEVSKNFSGVSNVVLSIDKQVNIPSNAMPGNLFLGLNYSTTPPPFADSVTIKGPIIDSFFNGALIEPEV